jgi:hypothetical protein
MTGMITDVTTIHRLRGFVCSGIGAELTCVEVVCSSEGREIWKANNTTII